MTTCNIVAEFFVDTTKMDRREWKDVDIRKTAHSRGWTTRYVNKYLKMAPKGKIVTAKWECLYNQPETNLRFTGMLVGINGKLTRRIGVFEGA